MTALVAWVGNLPTDQYSEALPCGRPNKRVLTHTHTHTPYTHMIHVPLSIGVSIVDIRLPALIAK